MQEVIVASTRMRPEAEGGGLCEGHHVVGSALQGLACMSMDNNIIGMRALLMHETTSKRIDKEKGNDATGNKKKKDPKKKERWSKAEKQEAAKKFYNLLQMRHKRPFAVENQIIIKGAVYHTTVTPFLSFHFAFPISRWISIIVFAFPPESRTITVHIDNTSSNRCQQSLTVRIVANRAR